MSARLRELVRRREQLVARSTAERDRLAQAALGLGRGIAVLDAVLDAVRHVRRHRAVLGLVAGAVLILAPRAALRWVPRIVWIAPLAVEGYRLARSLRAPLPAAGAGPEPSPFDRGFS